MILRNVRFGALAGLLFTAFLSVIVVVLYIFSGGSARFEANDTTLLTTIMAYVAGGLAGGVIGGLLAPLVKSALGAMLVGVVVAVPFLTALFIAIDGWANLSNHLLALCIMAPVLGVAGGLGGWKGAQEAGAEMDPASASK